MISRILFVCAYGRDRSQTAADLYRDLNGIQVRAEGVNRFALVCVSEADMRWADVIACMSLSIMVDLEERFHELHHSRMVNLDIENKYRRGSSELRLAIRIAMKRELPELEQLLVKER